MAFEKKVVYRHEIDEFGNIGVKEVTQILEDGKVISSQNHRYVVHPGEIKETDHATTKTLAALLHTPEVIEDFQDRIAEKI